MTTKPAGQTGGIRQRSFAMSTTPSTTLRIVCVQANPTVGALQDNFAIIRRRREQYRGKADLLVFSECFGTG
jgi:NAD+ synthase